MRPSTPLAAALLLLSGATVSLAGATVKDPSHLPHKTEQGQTGYNDCEGRPDSPDSQCQTAVINSLEDFCLFAPATTATIGESERTAVAYCTKGGHGARLIPPDTLRGVHTVTTPHYLQITGVGDLTKLHIPRGDDGGELDPHGADGNGNPIGGIVVGERNGRLIQYAEWTQFISDGQFCIRACFPGPDAARWCQHIYDLQGCAVSLPSPTAKDNKLIWTASKWNMPASYAPGTFETCEADDTVTPMGVYRLKDGSLSTWYQEVKPTPKAHPVPRSSSCQAVPTIAPAGYRREKRDMPNPHYTQNFAKAHPIR